MSDTKSRLRRARRLPARQSATSSPGLLQIDLEGRPWPQNAFTPTLETPARNQSTVSCSNKLCPDKPAMRLHGFRHESNALAAKSRNNRERCIPCFEPAGPLVDLRDDRVQSERQYLISQNALGRIEHFSLPCEMVHKTRDVPRVSGA